MIIKPNFFFIIEPSWAQAELIFELIFELDEQTSWARALQSLTRFDSFTALLEPNTHIRVHVTLVSNIDEVVTIYFDSINFMFVDEIMYGGLGCSICLFGMEFIVIKTS